VSLSDDGAMLMCPYCGNCLLVEKVSQMRFYCPTCPYVRPITKALTKKLPVKRKVLDDVMGGGEGGAQMCEAPCEKCGNKQASYIQVQIRSGDEGSTTFFRCTKCHHQWKDQ
jgi:DNA-directed RNA polymerase III subunit RPC11